MKTKLSEYVMFTNKSLFFHYSKILAVWIVFPIVILSSIFLYSLNRNSVEQQINTSSKFYEEKYSEQFNEMVNNIYILQNMVLTSPEIMDYYYTEYEDDNSLKVLVNRISNILSNICFSSNYIDSIYLCGEQQKYVLSNVGNGFLENFQDKIVMKIINGEETSNIFHRRLSGKSYLTFVMQTDLYNYSGGKLIFNLDCEKISGMFLNNEIKNIYITDSEKNVIYSNIIRSIGTNLNKIENENIIQCNTETILGISFEYNRESRVRNNYTGIIVVYSLILCIVMLISLIVLSNSFSATLIDLMALLENNEIDDHSIKSINFKNLAKNTINVVKKNSLYEKELVVQYNKLKRAQTMILQNQMNPHFLFNTLNAVVMMDCDANNGTPTNISNVVNLLSNLLRASLSTQTYTISLEQELLFIKQYMELQNIKYNGIISYEMNIADETKDMRVLKLMLQPLLENSLFHGVLKSKNPENEFIRIDSYIQCNNLIINIINSGEMIARVKLNELNGRLQNNEYPDSKHIGLLNVNARIKLIFGEQYGLEVLSDEQVTMVKITLPTEYIE